MIKFLNSLKNIHKKSLNSDEIPRPGPHPPVQFFYSDFSVFHIRLLPSSWPKTQKSNNFPVCGVFFLLCFVLGTLTQLSDCKSGKKNLCESVSFFGSAGNLPHTQGAFRENIEIHESQCHNILNSISYEEAAFAEPLAVSLHACSFLDNYANKKILISGCGPIGLLILKILLQSCDQTNIFVVDVNNNVLNSAKNLGIKNIINVNNSKNFIEEFNSYFDIAFESSGNINSINNILATINKGGKIIQVGNMPGGNLRISYNKIMLKELEIFGSYRFYKEFEDAVNAINNKLFKFDDMLTHKFKLDNCEEAMKIASNKDLSIKVQVYN